ncbi:MAG: tetratricopeptide repeat protein [Chloroflexota bacterium]|nr:tetratricopeptide repeat protein [Chloroflexota bacterium]
MEAVAEQIIGEHTYIVLEDEQPFATSRLWEMQRSYFESMGVEAWRRGEVPHYVTSNPRMANSYAEIVFALFRDRQRLAPIDEPLTVCELGAGSGRFAFHFLSRLGRLCDDAAVPLASFRYILTDLAQSNLDFWRAHPRFQSYFDAGMLDFALFDVTDSSALTMQRSGETIQPGSLHQPLVVIANYVFDSVPQDLFRINEGAIEECLMTMVVRKDEQSETVADHLSALKCKLTYRPLTEPPYDEAYLQKLLAMYRKTLVDSHLLFPAMGLRCLGRLQDLSQAGVVLLSADKGEHRLSALQGRPAPGLVRHGGAFSINVNYHAFKELCEHGGGIALFPTAQYRSVNVCCLIMVADAADHRDTRSAYRRFVEEFGPDDFFSITRTANEQIGAMSVENIVAYLRLSYYDGQQLSRCIPRLIELAPDFGTEDREAVLTAAEQAWELQYPLGEGLDLAGQIAGLCYGLADHARALTFLQHSITTYGEEPGTLKNMALCYQQLGDDERAERILASLPSSVAVENIEQTVT